MSNFFKDLFRQPSEDKIANYESYKDRNGKVGKHYTTAYAPNTFNVTIILYILAVFFNEFAFLLALPLLFKMISEKLFLQLFSVVIVGFSMPILVMLAKNVFVKISILFHPWIVLTLYLLMLLFLLSKIPFFKKKKLLNSGCVFNRD